MYMIQGPLYTVVNVVQGDIQHLWLFHWANESYLGNHEFHPS